MRRRPGQDRDLAAWLEADRAALPADASHRRRRADPADLDVGREPDAEQLLALPAQPLLLAPQPLVVGHLEGLIERRLVVARVVDDAGLGREGKLVRADEVPAAELGRVDPELAGGRVHDPLDEVDRLRPAGTAVGIGRGGGGVDRDQLAVDGRDVVAARQHQVRERRDGLGVDLRVGAEIGQDPALQAEDLAVLVDRQVDVVDLTAAVDRREVALAAIFDPLDRLVVQHGRPAGQDVLAVDVQLASEAAADLWHDHTDLVLRQRQHGRQVGPQQVGDLARRPDGQLLRPRVPLRDDAARLHRVGDEPLVDDPQADGLVRAGKGLVGRGLVADLDAVGHVVGRVLPDRGRALERALDVDDSRQLLIVGLDEVGPVAGRVAALGDHPGDRVADHSDLVDREGVAPGRADAGQVPAVRQRRGEVADRLGGVDRDYPGDLLGLRGVDALDAAMRDRAARDRAVECVDQAHVVGVGRAAGDEPGVLGALDARTDHRLESHCYLPPACSAVRAVYGERGSTTCADVSPSTA